MHCVLYAYTENLYMWNSIAVIIIIIVYRCPADARYLAVIIHMLNSMMLTAGVDYQLLSHKQIHSHELEQVTAQWNLPLQHVAELHMEVLDGPACVKCRSVRIWFILCDSRPRMPSMRTTG